MSGIYVYGDRDDEITATRGQFPDEIWIRVGELQLRLRTDQAQQLHAVLGVVLAADPGPDGA